MNLEVQFKLNPLMLPTISEIQFEKISYTKKEIQRAMYKQIE